MLKASSERTISEEGTEEPFGEQMAVPLEDLGEAPPTPNPLKDQHVVLTSVETDV